MHGTLSVVFGSRWKALEVIDDVYIREEGNSLTAICRRGCSRRFALSILDKQTSHSGQVQTLRDEQPMKQYWAVLYWSLTFKFLQYGGIAER